MCPLTPQARRKERNMVGSSFVPARYRAQMLVGVDWFDRTPTAPLGRLMGSSMTVGNGGVGKI